MLVRREPAPLHAASTALWVAASLLIAALGPAPSSAKDASPLSRALQAPQSLSLPPDSPRWMLEGQTKLTEYLGRKCLFLDGGAASVKDFDLRDGVIDVDVATPGNR